MVELPTRREDNLHPLQRVVLTLFGGSAVVASVVVGVLPGGWGPLGGIVMALATGYFLLRRVVEEYLTPVQEWTLLAGSLVASFVLVVASTSLDGGQLSSDLVWTYVGGLAVCGLFGYRALLRRRR